MMEEKVFPLPAVAGLLSKNFIEAWIHTDHATKGEEQQALSLKLVGALANPQYVIVDPLTMKVSKKHQLSGHWNTWEDKFVAFLKAQL